MSRPKTPARAKESDCIQSLAYLDEKSLWDNLLFCQFQEDHEINILFGMECHGLHTIAGYLDAGTH